MNIASPATVFFSRDTIGTQKIVQLYTIMAVAATVAILEGDHCRDTDFSINIPSAKYLRSDTIVQILLNG